MRANARVFRTSIPTSIRTNIRTSIPDEYPNQYSDEYHDEHLDEVLKRSNQIGRIAESKSDLHESDLHSANLSRCEDHRSENTKICYNLRGGIMLEKITAIIKNQLGKKVDFEITPETRFDAIDLDSIDVVEIIFGIEDEFGVQFDDAVAQGFEKVGDILQYLEQKK